MYCLPKHHGTEGENRLKEHSFMNCFSSENRKLLSMYTPSSQGKPKQQNPRMMRKIQPNSSVEVQQNQILISEHPSASNGAVYHSHVDGQIQDHDEISRSLASSSRWHDGRRRRREPSPIILYRTIYNKRAKLVIDEAQPARLKSQQQQQQQFITVNNYSSYHPDDIPVIIMQHNQRAVIAQDQVQVRIEAAAEAEAEEDKQHLEAEGEVKRKMAFCSNSRSSSSVHIQGPFESEEEEEDDHTLKFDVEELRQRHRKNRRQSLPLMQPVPVDSQEIFQLLPQQQERQIASNTANTVPTDLLEIMQQMAAKDAQNALDYDNVLAQAENRPQLSVNLSLSGCATSSQIDYETISREEQSIADEKRVEEEQEEMGDLDDEGNQKNIVPEEAPVAKVNY